MPGVYDLFHIGHLNVLRNAREFCDYLIATDRWDKLESDFTAVGVDVAYMRYTQQTSSTMLRRLLARELDGL